MQHKNLLVRSCRNHLPSSQRWDLQQYRPKSTVLLAAELFPWCVCNLDITPIYLCMRTLKCVLVQADLEQRLIWQDMCRTHRLCARFACSALLLFCRSSDSAPFTCAEEHSSSPLCCAGDNRAMQSPLTQSKRECDSLFLLVSQAPSCLFGFSTRL